MPNYHTPNSRMNPTRFPGGFNTANVTDAMAKMGQNDPSRLQTDFTDFNTFTAADWTITKVGTGTTALAAGAGGLLLVTNTAGATDSVFFQRTVASFVPVVNKRAFFKIRFQTNDATLTDIQAGLIVADTTPLDATDGIYFYKPTGAAAIGAFVRKDATTGNVSNTAIGTLVAATYTTWAFHYNGKDAVEFFIDDALVATLAATTTNLPDATLALSFGIQNGAAVAKTLTVDYIMAAIER